MGEGTAASKEEDALLEAWKETNAFIRHWEVLFFDSVKNYYTVIGLSIGAAGAATALSPAPFGLRVFVALSFLTLASILSYTAFRTTESQQSYLKRYYFRRAEIEARRPELKVRLSADETASIEGEAYGVESTGGGRGPVAKRRASGQTAPLIRFGFACMLALSVALALLCAATLLRQLAVD